MEPLQADDPRKIGPFRVLGRLGAGGMGQVLLAEAAGGRRVACKLVRREIADEPGFRERFRREVRIARTTPPAATARYVDADPDADRPWLATEYVDGPSVRQLVRDRGPLPPGRALPLLRSIAAALAALHDAGVVHRDLTPSNVLLDADGPKLIDFGISRAVGSLTMTVSGQVLGTPAHMSPEQVESARGVGPATDVFAFGSLAAYLTTGRSPFDADSVAGVLYKVAHAAPDLDGLPPPLHDLVVRCLEKRAADRPDIHRVAAALAAVDPDATGPTTARGGTGRARPPAHRRPTGASARSASRSASRSDSRSDAAPRRSRLRSWLLAAGALAALAVAGAAAVLLLLVLPVGGTPDDLQEEPLADPAAVPTNTTGDAGTTATTGQLVADVIADECLLDAPELTELLGEPVESVQESRTPDGTSSCVAITGDGPRASINVYEVVGDSPEGFVLARSSPVVDDVAAPAVLVETDSGPTMQVAGPDHLVTLQVVGPRPTIDRWAAAGNAMLARLPG